MADGQNPIPGFDINSISKMFGGALPNFGSMLNGININQLMPLVPSIMKMMGGGLGNLGGIFGGNPAGGNTGVNTGSNPGYVNGYNGYNGYNNYNGYNGFNSGYGQAPLANSGFPLGNPAAPPFVVPPHLAGDPKFLILNTIKPMVPPDKVYIVDQIGRLLVLYITITSLLPKRSPVPAAPIVTEAPAASAASSASPASFTALPAVSSGT